jgi:hypothetical protein
MPDNRVKKRAEGLEPFKDQGIRKYDRWGAPIWSGVQPTRFAMPLPERIKGPANHQGAKIRAEKGLKGYKGTRPPGPLVPGRPPSWHPS